MRSTTALAMLLATTLAVPEAAHADVGPPAEPTMFLVVQRDGLTKARLRAIRLALAATLPKLDKRFRAVLITEGAGRTPHATAPMAGRKSKQLLAALEPSLAPKPRRLERLLIQALSSWTGSRAMPRHHMIVLPAQLPRVLLNIRRSLALAVPRGFTVSFLLPSKPKDPKVAKDLELGAGHAVVTNARTLKRALQRELRWTKLSKADEARRTALLPRARPAGVLGVLRGGGGVGRIFGRGGLGLKGRGRPYVPKRFARGDVIVGKLLAVGFRRLRCDQICDVASVRKQLLAKAKTLLVCLERDVKLNKPSEVLRIPLDDKLDTPAARCVRSWQQKLGRPKLKATVEIGDARAVR